MWALQRSNTLQHNSLQHAAKHCNTPHHTHDLAVDVGVAARQRIATHCNTLQHTATYCNTLQHTTTHCNTLQHTTSYESPCGGCRCCGAATQHTTLQQDATHHTTPHYNTPHHTKHLAVDVGVAAQQHIAPHCNTTHHTTLQHTTSHESPCGGCRRCGAATQMARAQCLLQCVAPTLCA